MEAKHLKIMKCYLIHYKTMFLTPYLPLDRSGRHLVTLTQKIGNRFIILAKKDSNKLEVIKVSFSLSGVCVCVCWEGGR